jgi:hypothetical protein
MSVIDKFNTVRIGENIFQVPKIYAAILKNLCLLRSSQVNRIYK